MDKITSINNNLKVKEVFIPERTIISVTDDNREILLSDVRTNRYFWNKWISDENYIVAYSRGCMFNQIPITIEAAYSIKEKRLLDLSDKRIKMLFEYMLIVKKGFGLDNVLSEINNSDLGLLNEEEKFRLHEYLTFGNKSITHSDIINYILYYYPELNNYTGLRNKLSVLEYRNIEDSLSESIFWFHIMPQELIPNENGFKEVYMSEQEEQKRVLSLKK